MDTESGRPRHVRVFVAASVLVALAIPLLRPRYDPPSSHLFDDDPKTISIRGWERREERAGLPGGGGDSAEWENDKTRSSGGVRNGIVDRAPTGGRSRCLRILAIGGSVTWGSCGFAAKHPDAPSSKNDAWPALLEGRLNRDFPCGDDGNDGGGGHVVENGSFPGCSARCLLENAGTYLPRAWDVVVIEPTANTAVGEMNHMRALVASFAAGQGSAFGSSSPAPRFVFLSASFRLTSMVDGNPPLAYEQLPKIEEAVSSLASQWHVPFVSLPRFLFSHGLYNASNHQRHCVEARCTYWLDGVHITKTAHRMLADMLMQVILGNAAASVSNVAVDGLGEAQNRYHGEPFDLTHDLSPEVKKLIPPAPSYWLSFRTRSLPTPESLPPDEAGGLVCIEGFLPHDSRGRLSAKFESGPDRVSGQNATRRRLSRGGDGKYASFVLRLPSPRSDGVGSVSEVKLRIEFLHSYTTNGTLQLESMEGRGVGEEPTRGVGPGHDPSCRQWKTPHGDEGNSTTAIGSFNASNPARLSVSSSREFRVGKAATHIKGTVRGGDFHLLSLAVYHV